MTSYFNWNHYLPYHARVDSFILLQQVYTQTNPETAHILASEKHELFCSHLEHAEAFYIQSNTSPLTIQPILQFYGFTHLLKAAITIKDPFYPEKSNQLAHGVTSRKRKKRDFSFLEDTVKIQKNGLYTVFTTRLLNRNPLPVTITMEELFQSLETNRQDPDPIQAHFLLLYNLSMIARYETEWWNQCITYKKTADYAVIRSFLAYSAVFLPEEMLKYLTTE
ncbi:YaaC family protein [Jeotgalibacillus sp. R-1-5s-1]|uniref:YaaC family protein n=1 Tax=Jeotgalibacillus sp. R-1-5s-1 TaxID=2555897 RepID=UPI00141AA67B|nr:YaaC family protein [Jeotgalibacillus sp. R-1-5s-1]